MTLVGLDCSSPSAIRISFLALLVAQMNLPTWPTYWSYYYPLDYLTNLGPCNSRLPFIGTCIGWVPSACTGGPAGTLPKFDFIIAGAGPAGSALAYRLALQYPKRYVLLIEPGDAPPVNVIAPTWFPFAQTISSTLPYTAESKPLTIVDGPGNTATRTEGTTENYGLGYTNGMPCNAGKALGGTTAINAMLYVCGTSEDYNGWANYTGDNSWGWGTGNNNDGMWAYYKKTMKMVDPNIPASCANYYGTSGQVVVVDAGSTSPGIPLLKGAATDLGLNFLADINCGKWIGLANIRQTISYGERYHAARAYLSPLALPLLSPKAPNAMVMRNSYVDKVLLTGTLGGTVTATGVRVVTSNTNCPSFNVLAKNEIILTAGAFNSPLILQRSGVGRKADLSGTNNGVAYTVPQLVDSPVGANYHDHPFDLTFFQVDATPQELNEAETVTQLLLLAGQAENYYFNRTGIFSWVGSIAWQFFINTNDNPINHNSFPNIQLVGYMFDVKQPEFTSILIEQFRIKPEYANAILAANQDKKIFMCFNTLLNPKSRGLVKIRSTDPRDFPRIYTNYFTDPQDVTTSNAGLNKLVAIFNTPTMQAVNASMVRIPIAECDTLTYQSDAYWNCYRKYFGQNEWHPAGTTKMGKTTDATAVVDSKGLVKGITGTVKVRVADNSIMPQVISGNTQCPAYAIGEKIADVIKTLYV